jgi:hypothetical protein
LLTSEGRYRFCCSIKPADKKFLPIRQNIKELSMKVLSFLGAVGLGVFSGAWILASRRRRAGAGRSFVNKSTININEASQQEIIGRMVIPGEIYNSIKHRISYKAS